MKLKVVSFLVLMGILLTTQVEARFPEFGFCPLGGPPGWFNRISGQSHRYYYPPPPYPTAPSAYVPYYRVYASPDQQPSRGYFQQNRVSVYNR